jgi:hypothetical protein
MVCLFMLGLPGGVLRATAAAAAEAPDPVALNWATRAAIARGVAYLKERSAADPEGWIAPPYRQRTIVGYTNTVRRFSMRPTPLYEYETYTVYRRAPGESSQSSKALVPVQLQRVKRMISPEGGPERMEYDPNGSISKTVGEPIYGGPGGNMWFFGRLGQNAMALYALREAGVPGDDPAVSKVAGNLAEFVELYGMPDATWDLAWMATAFSRLSGQQAEDLTRKLASKLLDGQITEGAARGLWGPCCINLPLLEYLMAQEEAAFGKGMVSAKAKPSSGQSAKTAARAAEKAEEAKAQVQAMAAAIQADIHRVSMLARKLDEVDTWQMQHGDGNAVPIIGTAGLPDYVLNQISADLENTALVLFALREVSDAGRLPEKTWRPGTAKPAATGKARIPPPETAEAVMARAVHALAQLQGSDGGWTEANIHQPVKVFERYGKTMGMPGIPVDVNSFKPLPSPQTAASCLQGYSALLNAARIAGLAKVQAKFPRNLAAGLARAGESAMALPDIRPPEKSGGMSPAYDAGFYAGDACVRPGTSLQDRRGTAMRLNHDIVGRLQPKGCWASTPAEYVPLFSSATRARFSSLDRYDPKAQGKLMDRGVAHVRWNWGSGIHAFGDPPALATSFALAALSRHVRPPVAVCRWGEGTPMPPTVEPVVMALARKAEAPWYYTELKWPLTSPDLEIAPLLFASGKGAFTADEATRRSLEGFFKRGGLAILQAPATAEGKSFLQSAGAAFAACGEAGAVSDVASSERVLGALAGKLNRPLKGALRKDGSPMAVLIPLADPGVPANDAFRPDEAVKLTVAVLERNMDAALLAPDYAWNLGTLGDATNVYASAMSVLSGTEKKAKAAATEPPAKTPPAAAPAAPAAAAPVKVSKDEVDEPAKDEPLPAPRAPAADERL